MPYNFVPLGGTQVQTDLRTIGAFSGTATNIISTRNTPYVGGYALNVNASGTASSSAPGTTADYFCYQMTTKTNAQLYTQGGWGCYWRSMTWINNSVASGPVWDGTKFWLPTTTIVSGNWIGQSPDGKSWNYVQVVGSQAGGANGYGLALNGVFGYNDNSGAFRYYSSASNSMQSTTLASGFRALGGAVSATRAALSGVNQIFTTTDITGAWTAHSVTGTWYAATNIPGTSVWIFCGTNATNKVARSTDDLATAPTIVSGFTGNLYAAAASSTAVILAGQGTTGNVLYRSTDQGASWNQITFGGTYVIGGAYGNGKFVLAGYNTPNVYVSEDDGLTWTAYPTGFPNTLSAFTNGNVTDGLRFYNGRFWLTCTQQSANTFLLASSADGRNWEMHMSAPLGVTSGTATTSCQGVFAADNVSGTPTNANTSVGFGLNTFPPVAPSHYPVWVVNNAVVGSGAPSQTLGVNQWHEYQIFGRPAATANEWNITFIVDGVAYGPFTTNTFAAKASMPLWFLIGRGNFFTVTSDIVFYDFPLAQDPGVLGPDLRVYYDQPTSDLTKEWNPSIVGQSNAAMVSTTSVTNATTYVYESGSPKSDTYNMASTIVPASHSVLSTKNTAYFSKMAAGDVVVSVGTQMNGENFDGASTLVSSPVNSWTYVTQDQPVNPDTGAPWTLATLNQEKLRINRVTPSAGGDPNWFNVSLLARFDEGAGSLVTLDSSGRNTMQLGSGSALVSTAKFGPSALAVNETGGTLSGITLPRTDSLTFLNLDFTFEAWVNPIAHRSTGMLLFITGAGNPQNSNNLWAVVRPGGVLELNLAGGSNFTILTTSASFPIPIGEWTHVAVVRVASTSTYSVYIGGVLAGSGVQAGSLVGQGATFGIGSGIVNTLAWYGYIDEVRITKGVARYTAPFTPPTAPFPDYF